MCPYGISILSVIVFVLMILNSGLAADFRSAIVKTNPLVFHQVGNEFTFDTGILRGKLHAGGKPTGLTEVIHIPTERRLDSSMGILSFYRVFNENKRYGSAAWDWPNPAVTHYGDGSVKYSWSPENSGRSFIFEVEYRWQDARTLDVRIWVTPLAVDLKGFESFLASYFDKSFATPAAYVAQLSDTGKPGFLIAKKDAGDWQMFPRDDKSAPLIQDGRWTIEPNPVNWAIRPTLAAPLCIRRDTESKLTVILMAPPKDCFAVAMPYEGEAHNSLYLSLFGRQPGDTPQSWARTRFVVAESITDAEIVERYQEYLKQLPNLNSGIEK